MNRVLISAIVFFSAVAVPVGAIGLTPAEEMIVKVMKSGRVSEDRKSLLPPDIQLIPANQRDAVILRLREVQKMTGGRELFGTTVVTPVHADMLLLRMGDVFTIEKMIGHYRRYDSAGAWEYMTSVFRAAKQPKVIAYLAADFFLAEDPKKGITASGSPGDGEFVTIVPARSIFSGVMTAELIKSSKVFSPEMVEWANEALKLRRKSPDRFRELMRIWWLKNEAAIRREDYGAVVSVIEGMGK